MGDMILALVCIASGLGAATGFGLAFRHHWQIVMHEQQQPQAERSGVDLAE